MYHTHTHTSIMQKWIRTPWDHRLLLHLKIFVAHIWWCGPYAPLVLLFFTQAATQMQNHQPKVWEKQLRYRKGPGHLLKGRVSRPWVPDWVMLPAALWAGCLSLSGRLSSPPRVLGRLDVPCVAFRLGGNCHVSSKTTEPGLSCTYWS